MKDPLIFIRHIKESIDNIESFSKGLSKTRFIKDRLIQSAIIRQIEIIGEAVKNLPIGFTVKYPYVEWSKIAGTRDKMIHSYFSVDLDLTYEILKKDIPKLKRQISAILINLEQDSKE